MTHPVPGFPVGGGVLRTGLLFLAALFCLSCGQQGSRSESDASPAAFGSETLRVPDQGGRKIRGQLLYMPIYSNLPYHDGKEYDLSAFLAIHNTDLSHTITITKVDYFNTDGKIVKRFLAQDRRLDPLATAIFTIAKKDRSGTGANFLVEWVADQPVNEPLVESIMKDLAGNLGISFLSQGRIMREVP